MAKSKKQFVFLFLMFFSIITIPNFMFTYLQLESQSMGLITAITLVLTLLIISSKKHVITKKIISSSIAILLLILTHYSITTLFVNTSNHSRVILSIITLAFMIFVGFIFVNYLSKVRETYFDSTIKLCFYLLFFNLVYSSFTITMQDSKQMLIFNEPSHFALVYLPFLGYIYYTSNRLTKLFYLISTIIASLIIENLTLLTGSILIFSIFINKNLMGTTLVVITFTLIFPYIEIENSYFKDRINLSADSTNLSTLSYLSGWYDINLNIRNTYGFGIGFQQLGFTDYQNHAIRESINFLGADGLNIYDGSFLAAKIISEFGIIGVAAILMYLYKIIIYSKMLSVKKINSKMQVFFMITFITFSINIFFRGLGYFSPQFFLFMCSLIWLFLSNQVTKN